MPSEKNKSEARAITLEDVPYFQDARGLLVRPKRRGNYPGVLIIHEFWGLSDGIKNIAKDLAAQGFIVFAVDLFHGQVTADPERAFRLVKNVDQAEAIRNMRTAIEYLRVREKVEKIASMGWCFGGGQSLQLSISGEKLDGIIIYYGNLVTDQKLLSKINWPVLGIFGDKDEVVSVQKVREFETALNMLHIENEIYVYPGVGHAFANPSNRKFAPKETEDAWNKSLAFLNRNLKFFRRVKVKVIPSDKV